MTDIDTAARYAVEGRRSFPPRSMAGTPDWEGMAARTMLRFPKIMAALHEAERQEDRRRLRINDGISIQRSSGQISVVFSNDGMIHSAATLTNEQARRAAEALSFYAATADAVDVEDDGMGRAA